MCKYFGNTALSLLSVSSSPIRPKCYIFRSLYPAKPQQCIILSEYIFLSFIYTHVILRTEFFNCILTVILILPFRHKRFIKSMHWSKRVCMKDVWFAVQRNFASINCKLLIQLFFHSSHFLVSFDMVQHSAGICVAALALHTEHLLGSGNWPIPGLDIWPQDKPGYTGSETWRHFT